MTSNSLNEDAALRIILEGTAGKMGEAFFHSLVENLTNVLGTSGAWVTEYFPATNTMRAIAFQIDRQWHDGYEFDLTGTPCNDAIRSRSFVQLKENLLKEYPDDEEAIRFNINAYFGLPLLDTDGEVLGHTAVLDHQSMPDDPRAEAIFKIFAAKAAAELQRLRREQELHESRVQIDRMVDSAMDAIIEIDGQCVVSRFNSAAEKVFRCEAKRAIGESFGQFLSADSRSKLKEHMNSLGQSQAGQQSLWIPGGLKANSLDGVVFEAETTLSRFEVGGKTLYALILRNLSQRLQAEQKIRVLSAETAYLREQLAELKHFGQIVGESELVVKMLKSIEQVAPSEANVLVLGETGTGKELVALAVHAASARSEGPMIRVNCAAIPGELIESELFGHEKGAFTGATQKRDGRFALADGGTIFLDEVGELAIDLQVKLLRVLQEGEFEPVGSSRTHQVDVRVVAATNRDLKQAVAEGEFREDLYYRLHVFPVDVPPLRERGDDIIVLATFFAERFLKRSGRKFQPFQPWQEAQLKRHDWPGNVRELQNVIERAVITSRDGVLDLESSLPLLESSTSVQSSGESGEQILSAEQLLTLERNNMLLALKASKWTVSGDAGAAKLLGLNASTFNSRMRALDIQRPQ